MCLVEAHAFFKGFCFIALLGVPYQGEFVYVGVNAFRRTHTHPPPLGALQLNLK
jgi:hypothetical protein